MVLKVKSVDPQGFLRAFQGVVYREEIIHSLWRSLRTSPYFVFLFQCFCNVYDPQQQSTQQMLFGTPPMIFSGTQYINVFVHKSYSIKIV